MKRLCGLTLVVLALVACGGSAKNAASSSTTHPTFASSSTDYGAYCAVMKRTDAAVRAQGSGIDPAAAQAAGEAELERFTASPPELDGYWRQYLNGGHNADAVKYLKDWTYTHCGFEPYIGGS